MSAASAAVQFADRSLDLVGGNSVCSVGWVAQLAAEVFRDRRRRRGSSAWQLVFSSSRERHETFLRRRGDVELLTPVCLVSLRCYRIKGNEG